MMKNYFEKIVHLVFEKYHLDISPFAESFVEKTITSRLETLSNITSEEYITFLESEPQEATQLFESFSNCYSEFFRNSLTFSMIEQVILPRLFKEKEQFREREVRIWSAGCSSGQEAYSIAFLIEDYKQVSKTGIGCLIFATDIQKRILENAKRGIYSKEALRNVKLDHFNRYFINYDNQLQVISSIRDRIDFSWFDLLDKGSSSPPASIYGDFDLIFCSNVLYYYKPEVQRRILAKLHSCLNVGGFLVTSEAEKGIAKQIKGFRQFAPPAAVFIKKH